MKKVLVIEHDRMKFLDVKIAFAKHNFEVIYGNKYILEVLAKSNIMPDLIILDLASLKSINGIIKFSFSNYSKFKNVPVILTSSNLKSAIKFCLSDRLNIIGEVLKPYDSNSLYDYYDDFIPTIPINHNQVFAHSLSKI